MTIVDERFAVIAQSSFGRDGAMFEGLLGFVAQLSVALWSLVVLTAVLRFVGIRIYRKAAARKAIVEIESAPSADVLAAVTAPVAVPVTAPVTAPVSAPTGASHHRRAERIPAGHAPAHANDSVDA